MMLLRVNRKSRATIIHPSWLLNSKTSPIIDDVVTSGGSVRSAKDLSSVNGPWRTGVRWTLLALAAAAVLIFPYLALESRLDGWGRALLAAGQAHRLIAAVLIVGLLAGDVLLPVPSSAVNALAGLLFGWVVGAALIWLGLSLGCLLGYALGARGARPLARWMVGDADLERAVARFGPAAAATLVLTRAVPVLAEAGTLAAGAAGLPLGRYLGVTSLANAGVAIVYAGVGAAALSANSFLLAFLAAAGLPALAWGVWRLAGRRPRAVETSR
jgi:uncharacterized membrane protein YdjX (TVP38/TMEM64 family)